MVSATQLSTHDSSILGALFDAESALSPTIHIDTSIRSNPAVTAAELRAIRPLNVAEPSPAAIQSAIDALTSLIRAHPQHASAYVNRAQALRLQLPTHDLFTAANTRTTAALLSDLRAAIALASPASPASPLSAAHARVLSNAHTHRAYLLMHAANVADASAAGVLSDGAPEELRGRGKDDLEEMASRDFMLGGRYGNGDARQMAVKTNPYAKMCGAIVKEAMRKELTESDYLKGVLGRESESTVV